jgi:hypothetical protein
VSTELPNSDGERLRLTELADRLRAEAVARVPGRLAHLIELRVEQLIGLADPGAVFPADLDDAERAVVDVTEQFMVDVHGLSDEQFALLGPYYSDADVVAIMFHLALVDGFGKLRLVIGQ